jgi:hypothetical protein
MLKNIISSAFNSRLLLLLREERGVDLHCQSICRLQRGVWVILAFTQKPITRKILRNGMDGPGVLHHNKNVAEF